MTAADFGFSDAVDGNAFSAVKISTLPGAGSLTYNNGPVSVGQFVTVTDINLGLLKFTPAANANGAGYASFTFQVEDDGGTANGGVNLDAIPNTITFDITAVNDAPVVSVPGTQVTTQNVAVVFSSGNGNAITIADADAGTNALEVTLTSSHGLLTLSGVSGLTFTTGDGTADASMVFTGTLADLNAALSGLQFQPAGAYFGPASVDLSVDDLGNSGIGGSQVTSSSIAVTVDLAAAPNAGVDSYSVNEDGVLNVPAGSGVLQNDSAPSLEPLTAILVGGPSHASAFSLNADGSFTYTPVANYAGADTFSYKANDGTQDSAVVTVSITVNPVNDAPAGSDATIIVTEDATHVFAAADFGFSDLNDTPANAFIDIVINSLPAAGALTYGGNPVNAGDTIAVADLANLAFTPGADENRVGYASFTFQVQDGGSTANGGVNLDATPNTITLNVTAVNDAPVITRNALSIAQGGAVKLKATDLAATDVDNATGSLVFTVSAVQHGHFELITAPGVAILSFTQAQLTGNTVRFVHDGSSSAPKYDVSVSDGSLATAAAPASIAFTPTPAPTGGGVVPPGQGGTPPGQGNKGGGGTTPGQTGGGVPGTTNGNGNGKGGSTQGGRSSGSQNGGSGDAAADAVVTNQIPEAAAAQAAGARRGSGFGPPGVVTASVPGMAMRWGGHSDLHLNGVVGEGAKPLFQDLVLQVDTKPVEHHGFQGNAATDWAISNAFVSQAKLPERELVPILLDNAQIGGVAFSVGVVWWASRITGVLGSVLASAPAWEELDPLPVTDIVDEKNEPEDYDDPQAEADEEAVGMVLEGPTAKA